MMGHVGHGSRVTKCDPLSALDELLWFELSLTRRVTAPKTIITTAAWNAGFFLWLVQLSTSG